MSAFVYAQDDILAELNELSSEYKNQEMPEPFKMVFGNENINIHIDEINVYISTENGIMTEFKQGHSESPTMNIYTSEATLKRIMNSDEPAEELKKALDNKEITYKGVGIGKKVKLFFVKIIAKIASWFM